MASYHFHLTQVKRSRGQSVIAQAAYRAGEKLYSTYYGESSDFTRKRGVVMAEICLPDHAPREYADRETLWNALEWAETGRKAQLAHSFDITLMNEFSMEENIEMARTFVREELVSRGMIVEKVEKEKSQDIRVVYQQKDSLAKKENPVAFSLSDEGLIWMGEYDISIDDLLAGNTGTKKETKLEKAKKLILELLGKRKMMCLKELEAELQAYEISARTGRDARKDLEDQLIYGWYQSRKTISLKKDS